MVQNTDPSSTSPIRRYFKLVACSCIVMTLKISQKKHLISTFPSLNFKKSLFSDIFKETLTLLYIPKRISPVKPLR